MRSVFKLSRNICTRTLFPTRRSRSFKWGPEILILSQHKQNSAPIALFPERVDVILSFSCLSELFMLLYMNEFLGQLEGFGQVGLYESSLLRSCSSSTAAAAERLQNILDNSGDSMLGKAAQPLSRIGSLTHLRDDISHGCSFSS